MIFDIIIKNATIYNGENISPYIADVGIVGEKIAKIGKIDNEANIIIDATNKILTPGFIDAHSHGDQAVFGDPFAKNQLQQGITTEITGQCGNTAFPNNGYIDPFIYAMLKYKTKEEVQKIVEKQKTFKDYIEYLQKIPIATNIISQVGHGAIREFVMGSRPDKPKEKELEQMKELLVEAMENGALGISTGLIYAPGFYSTTEELIELVKVVTKYGGRYSSHIRSESNNVIEATAEAIKIGEESGCQVILSHHKANGKKNWGKSVETLKLVDDAVGRGVDIWLDQYPYNAGATKLVAIIPNEYNKEGLEAILKNLQYSKYRKELKKFIEADNSSTEILLHSANGWDGVILATNGKTIEEIAKEQNKDPYDIFFDIIIETKGSAMAIYKCMQDDDIERIMKYPRTTFGTDATHSSFINPFGHPRAFGSFPTILKKYTLEKKILTIQEAIYKSTGLTAKIARLKDRGLVKENYFADLNIIDLNKLKVNSSYSKPNGGNEGFNYVFVNGKIVVENDKVNNVLNGKILKK
ncbi:MAG: D-aminoacylase [Rickettsiales bacterium]|jgi:N-acyl-D-amino-acid deacylase|nr:D-aminoacylase [Rickettsiales bacterium]